MALALNGLSRPRPLSRSGRGGTRGISGSKTPDLAMRKETLPDVSRLDTRTTSPLNEFGSRRARRSGSLWRVRCPLLDVSQHGRAKVVGWIAAPLGCCSWGHLFTMRRMISHSRLVTVRPWKVAVRADASPGYLAIWIPIGVGVAILVRAGAPSRRDSNAALWKPAW